MAKQPVFSFLGYSILDIKYSNSHKGNSYISISITKESFNEINNVYSLLIRIATDCSDEESIFVFQADYLISDLNWFKNTLVNEKKSMCFSIVFPFIREKILSITSDSTTGIFIPILNIQNLSFENEIRLTRVINKNSN